jgi:DNA-binding transcriptional LysR family regulator
MLDVGRLQFFSEVARAGSFTEAGLAAVVLAVSGVAADRHAGAELGLTLIERGTRPLRLTDAGETLLRHAEIIFGEVATAEAQLRAIAHLNSGTLRLGGFPRACATILPQAIAQFLRDYPKVTLTLTEMRRKAAHTRCALARSTLR